MLMIRWRRGMGPFLSMSLLSSAIALAPSAIAAPGAPIAALASASKDNGIMSVRGGFGWGNRHWIDRERRTRPSIPPQRKGKSSAYKSVYRMSLG